MIKKVRKRDGRLIDYNAKKIMAAIGGAAEEADEKVATDKIIEEIEKKLDKQCGEEPPGIEAIQDVVEDVLARKGYTKTAKAYILYRHKKAEERHIKEALIGKTFKTDMNIATLKLLRDRYLHFLPGKQVFETPDEMFDRVADIVARPETVHKSGEVNYPKYKRLFKAMMKNLDFLPNSAALMNAGREGYALSSSIVLPLQDSIDSIYNTLTTAANMQQAGSGTGFSFSNLRPRGSNVNAIRGVAQGPVAFLKLFDYSSNLVMQSGRRMGANMAIISIDHPDVIDFINLKAKKGGVTNFNISIALTDEFIEAVILDRDYAIKDPTTGEVVENINAKQVFDIIVANAWEYGEPGVLFMDKINDKASVNQGKITATSPCAEFPLEDYECGFTGSINLSHFVEDRTIDWDRLKKIIHLSVRFLDNMIDANQFLVKKSKFIVSKNRKIGLGIMGLAQLFILMRIPYNSPEAEKIADEVMTFIKKEADEASKQLAEERGVFQSWERSIYAKDNVKLRNATRTAIAPTGTISMIANTSGGIEPLFALSYIRRITGGGDVRIVDEAVKEILIEEGIYSEALIEKIANMGIDAVEEISEELKKVFVTTHEIEPFQHVTMQAIIQKHVDNAVSKTVNLPKHATLIDVENVFLLAYKLGCKGCTVYREGSIDDEILSMTAFLKNAPETTRKHLVREELKVLMKNKSLDNY